VVTGNYDVGKSLLLFLFVRVLLELGVNVLYHFYKSYSLKFVLMDKNLEVFENEIIDGAEDKKKENNILGYWFVKVREMEFS
jgi:hypothetical protein